MTTPSSEPGWQVAECLVPGLTEAAAAALGQRLMDELAAAPASGAWFAGSLLLPEDEVLLCLFRGGSADVRAVSERAGLPFERIVPGVPLGWEFPPGDARRAPVRGRCTHSVAAADAEPASATGSAAATARHPATTNEERHHANTT